MKIEANKVVTLTYDLSVDGELIESVETSRPFTFIYGMGQLLPRFEENISNLLPGDEFQFDIKCEEAYGMASEENVIDLPKSIFEVDGEMDSEIVKEGNVVPMLDVEGNKHHGIVLEIKEEAVTMDFNHPLAGDDLSYVGKIIDVREATAEELAHGHVHHNHASSCNDSDCGGCGDSTSEGTCGCGC